MERQVFRVSRVISFGRGKACQLKSIVRPGHKPCISQWAPYKDTDTEADLMDSQTYSLCHYIFLVNMYLASPNRLLISTQTWMSMWSRPRITDAPTFSPCLININICSDTTY